MTDVYRIEKSFAFTAQIPDDSVGGSGSRCASCGGTAAYCEQICRACGFPFVGPYGFPQWSEWKELTTEQRENLVIEMYTQHHNRGRLGYSNVEYIPLTVEELVEVERLGGEDAYRFTRTHEVSPQKIRDLLIL